MMKKKVHMFTQLHVLNCKWRILIALREGKIRTLWTPDHVDDLRWRVEIDEDQS
jgi:hypothetical protein